MVRVEKKPRLQFPPGSPGTFCTFSHQTIGQTRLTARFTHPMKLSYWVERNSRIMDSEGKHARWTPTIQPSDNDNLLKKEKEPGVPANTQSCFYILHLSLRAKTQDSIPSSHPWTRPTVSILHEATQTHSSKTSSTIQ